MVRSAYVLAAKWPGQSLSMNMSSSTRLDKKTSYKSWQDIKEGGLAWMSVVQSS